MSNFHGNVSPSNQCQVLPIKVVSSNDISLENQKLSGISSTNQRYIRYDQVEKKYEYHLAEHSQEEEFDEEFQIQTIDISKIFEGTEQEKEEIAQKLGKALQEIGFAILIGHGIDSNLYQEAPKKIEEYFNSSLEDKLKFLAKRHGSINQGYFPIKETSNIHPDLVEGWVFCRRAFDWDETGKVAPEFWVKPELEPFFRNYVKTHEKLFLPIMQSILRYFKCDVHLYDKKLDKTNFGLRFNYYPPISEEDDKKGMGRLLGHEDIDMFTLLPAPNVEGLQVLNRRNNKWIRLIAPPGSIILNTGDYIQRITNDVLPSTTHRVSKPRDKDEAYGKTRISFPLNVYLWENELLEVLPCFKEPKYSPVKAIVFHTKITSKFYGETYAVTE